MIPSDSFTFGGVNSFQEFGIKVIAYDVFAPPKRPRSQTIPFRHGSYDYGGKFYDERIIRLECDTTKELTKAEMREVIHWLSRRSVLRLWDEQDKYYVGELMESNEVQVLPKRVFQRFTLPIVCEPFAYGEQVVMPITEGRNEVNYMGTAESPTLIIIKNPNDFPINTILLTSVRHMRG